MNTALLVIDVQQGLCEGEHGAFESQQVIARINEVSPEGAGGRGRRDLHTA
jgi:nicotinamidase-related amidase